MKETRFEMFSGQVSFGPNDSSKRRLVETGVNLGSYEVVIFESLKLRYL